ncbi:MAG: quinol:cytochrome C oxidoreductase [Flavobacteriaceae bacterium]
MYTFSGKLKTISIALMILGIIGMAYGFLTVPKDTHKVEEILNAKHDSHATNSHSTADVNFKKQDGHNTHNVTEHKAVDTHKADSHDTHASKDSHQAHLEHVLHQYQNKPWSAFFIAAFFFFMVALLVLVFYSIQWAAQAGWSIVIFRVMEAITAFLLPMSFFLLLFLVLSTLDFNHVFVWMGHDAVNDPVLVGKAPWLNKTGFLIRSFIFVTGWNIFRFFLRRNSIALDKTGDLKIYKRNFNIAVGFLGFFIVTELFFVFDLAMSLDPHWYSQLYPFYVFASMMVTAVTTILIVTVYLKSKGYLPEVKESHIHDLGKFMFGFSIFWAYFFFDQFMLQWYSNIPEDVVYWLPRLGSYKFPFLLMLVLNFVLPFLLLIGSDFKRVSGIIVTAGLFIIMGHYIDIFVLISPATVGDVWSFGIPEIASFVFFLGLFIYVVFNALSKAPLQAKGNPFMKESEHFHYYNL